MFNTIGNLFIYGSADISWGSSYVHFQVEWSLAVFFKTTYMCVLCMHVYSIHVFYILNIFLRQFKE